MSGPVRPTRFEAWLEERFPPYRFGLVFVLLVATYIVMAASPSNQAARITTVLLEGLTLIATLLAARVGRVLFRIAGAVVIGAVVAAIVSLIVGGESESVTGWFFAVNVLLVGAAPVAIGRALYRRSVIDVRTVLGAVCIYLLIGIMFAFLFAAMDAIGTRPFFAQTSTPGIQTFLYFSFVTQTTVGYGDYTAAYDLGRTLATTEALLGQIYLVTVVAVLVSRMTVVRRDSPVGDAHGGADGGAVGSAGGGAAGGVGGGVGGGADGAVDSPDAGGEARPGD